MKQRIIGGDKQHLRRLLLPLGNNYLLPIHRIFNLDSQSPDVDIVSNTTTTTTTTKMQKLQGITNENATSIHRICKRSENNN